MIKRAALFFALAAATASAAPAHAAFTPGSFGLGDPFFPNAGNGGYDVEHYALTLGYEPSANRLDGQALITATATQALSRLNLDLRGFNVSSVTVGGRAATYLRDGQELMITPAQPIRSGTQFTVAVA
jgi:aminopeptidase N